MARPVHQSFRADDRSYYAILKKEIHALAEQAGFSQKKLANIDLIVAELTSNLYKYAVGGEILAAFFPGEGEGFLEVICIDRGPGIKDPGKIMTDGFSTSDTLGHGLGSISRLSDFFELYSLRDWGTISVCRVYLKERSMKPPQTIPVVRHIIVAKPGETLSGDGIVACLRENALTLMIADGLGHGPDAHQAAEKAAAALIESPYTNPVMLLTTLHEKIRRSRGVVANIVTYLPSTKHWQISGVGNISGKFLSSSVTKSFVPYNGIVGHNIPRTMKEQVYQSSEFPQLILCSDGIKSRWDVARYTGIQKYDPSILAAAIYKDYARDTDDRSILICKVLTA